MGTAESLPSRHRQSNFLTYFKNAGNKLPLPQLNTLLHLGSEGGVGGIFSNYFSNIK